MITKALVGTIRSYQAIRRIFGISTCRFYPSCSHYAIEAIERHGIARGLFRSFARLLRCSPLSRGGYDPV